MLRKLSGIGVVLVLLLILAGGLFPLASPAAATSPFLPIVFVHGGAGSAQQFESQAMRFESNGYPANLLFAFEYDSSIAHGDPTDLPARMARLDAFIDAIRASTGADKVYLIGHSRGTTESLAYMGVSARAAKVAKYIAIDGSATAPPSGIPALAIWSALRPTIPTMPGATNVAIPNQPHVEVATSPEAFVEMFKFLTGNPPATSQIVPETSSHIQLRGRAVFFPQNRGTGDATLEIWEVNGITGARIGTAPAATYALSGTGFTDGAWGPFNAKRGAYYEFVLLRAGFRAHHFYCEPYIRSSQFVRLLTSPPGGLGDHMERDSSSVAMVISRQKEWWGSPGPQNESLTINGTNILNAATCPMPKSPGMPMMGIIGIFAYDRGLNKLTDLSAAIPYFFAQAFMTGIDVYIPGADPPNATTSLVLTPRGGGGRTQTLNILNWASDAHGVTVLFNDYLQIDRTPQQVNAATGTGMVSFSSSDGNVINVTPIAEQSLPATGKPAFRAFPHGLFSFTIANLVPGSTVTVTIALPSAMPPDTTYWKFLNNRWVDCTSLLGSNDGDNVLTLTITDGGLGDADGIANGIIFDPGGPAVSKLKEPILAPEQPRRASLPPADVRVHTVTASPDQVSAGQQVNVLVTVVNHGASSGSCNVALKINGIVEQQTTVGVPPRTSNQVRFTVTKHQPGTYEIDVDGHRASFTVLGSTAAKTSAKDSLIVLIVVIVLVLATIVVLAMTLRRPA